MLPPTRVKSVEIKNYRCLRSVALNDLPRMTVLVGANGSGKSTLLDAFGFLKDALAQNVAAAVERRGGYRELASQGQKGPIEVAVRFLESGGRLATYRLVVGERDDGRAFAEREILTMNGYIRPRRLMDFNRGSGIARANGAGRGLENPVAKMERYELDDPSALALKGLGQFRGFQIVSELRRLIEDWHISDLRLADARLSAADAGCAERLTTRGDNLALVARNLRENHPDRFERILEQMRRRVPGFSDVDTEIGADGRVALRFWETSLETPFMARSVSDGALNLFAQLVLLSAPEPHPLLVAEEPEKRLPPHHLWNLFEDFRGYALRGGQVFVSTNSSYFLDAAKPDEIFWLVKEEGFTSVKRVSENELLQSLIKGGDLPGWVWQQGIFEAAWTK